MTSLAGFCLYDGGPCTKKYKVVASSAKRKGWGLAKQRKFGERELEQMLTWPTACKPGWDCLEAAKRTLSPGLASLAPASQPPDSDESTHNSLMRMSGTQTLSVGTDNLVILSKSSGVHCRNSSVQNCGRSRHCHKQLPAYFRDGHLQIGQLSTPYARV